MEGNMNYPYILFIQKSQKNMLWGFSLVGAKVEHYAFITKFPPPFYKSLSAILGFGHFKMSISKLRGYFF
jgi:hypothetical protein